MRTRTALLALPILLVLSACTPTAATPTSATSETPTETVTPSATPTATATVDPNILFTITATATSPEGAIAHLSQVVYAPIAATDNQAADEAALDSECDGWRSTYPSPSFVVSDIDIVDASPSGTSWTYNVAVVSMDGSPVFTGAVSDFMAYCASDQIAIGSVRGVTPVQSTDGADGPHGWAQIEYGFGIATDTVTDVPGPTDTVLSDCQIVLSPAAMASTIASTWNASTADPLSCSFGDYSV